MTKTKNNSRAEFISASTGRSMIEMLGVLAIIGVLSIGGLAGFKIAMNYHRANETIHDVMLRATNVPMKWENYQNFNGNEFEFPDLGPYAIQNPVGYTVHTYPETTNPRYAFRVEVSNVPSEVCKRIHNMNPTAVDEIVPASANCEVESGILDKMTFYFDENFKGVGPIPGPDPDPDNPIPPNPPAEECELTAENCTGSTPDFDENNCKCVCLDPAPDCGDNECCKLTGEADRCGRPTANIGDLVDYYTLNDEGCLVKHTDGCEFTNYPVPTESCASPKSCNANAKCVCPTDKPYDYDGDCRVCPEGTPGGADETTCACPADKPVLDNATNSCKACEYQTCPESMEEDGTDAFGCLKCKDKPLCGSNVNGLSGEELAELCWNYPQDGNLVCPGHLEEIAACNGTCTLEYAIGEKGCLLCEFKHTRQPAICGNCEQAIYDEYGCWHCEADPNDDGKECKTSDGKDGTCSNGECIGECEQIAGCTSYTADCKCVACDTSNGYNETPNATGGCSLSICKPDDAEYNQELCEKCGWTWGIQFDEATEYYRCMGDAYCRAKGGVFASSSWVASTDFGEDYPYSEYDWGTCGGDGYCEAVYGEGSYWTAVFSRDSWKTQNGCGGDAYCKHQYGYGKWGVSFRSDSDTYYGCVGDSWCKAKYGANSTWNEADMGCYTNGSRDGCGEIC